MNSTIAPWGPLGYLTYKTHYARPLDENDPRGESEEWVNTVDRVRRGAIVAGAGYTASEADRFAEYMLTLKATPAGRGIWTLGSPLQQVLGSDAAVNCWFTVLARPEDYDWMVCRLMAGGGVGYGVELKYAYRWPNVVGGDVEHVTGDPTAWMVQDSREGWGAAIAEAIRTIVNGGVFKFDTSLVRPAGAPLRTFGGTASGPAPLIDGIKDMATILNGATGRKPRPLELSDLANICAHLVVAGGKRRSAELALGSGYDERYLIAKRWADESLPGWRSQANFSVNVTEYEDLTDEFWLPYETPGIGENFGIINTGAYWQGRTGEPTWRRDTVQGVNPCAEIGLPDKGSCNLATLHLPNIVSYDEARDAAKLLYRMQKAVSQLPHPDSHTQAIMNRDSRLGLSVTGYLQATDEQRAWLPDLYNYLAQYDEQYSWDHNLPRSIRLTTVKPEGTVSLLSGCTSGGHAAYSQWYVRRIRLHPDDKTIAPLRAANVPIVADRSLDGSLRQDQVVAEFPVSVPKGTVLSNEQTAIDQLEVLARLQRDWADNAVSLTVTYKDDEIPSVRNWLENNWSSIKGVSFLRYENHGFHLAPYEPIDEFEFDGRTAAIGTIEYSGSADMIDGLADCVGGACPIR